MKRRRVHGFTVVELAVMIAVIGILAAITIVVYGRAQIDARDAKRANDARIIDAALNKYYDANGMYPSGCGGTSCTGLPAQMTAPNTDIISTMTTSSQLSAILGSNTVQVNDPTNTTNTPFIGTTYSISNSTPGYVYRGAQTLSSGYSSYTHPLIELTEQGSSRKCSLSVTVVNTPPLDTSAYLFAYYEEGSKTWQIKFGDKGKKPHINSGATAGFCNIVN